MSGEANKFEGWVILELMGHRKLGGYLREETIGGASFLRIDVPDPEKDGGVQATQLYSPSAVYCITPTTQELAVEFARGCRVAPVARWELPPALEPVRVKDDDGEF